MRRFSVSGSETGIFDLIRHKISQFSRSQIVADILRTQRKALVPAFLQTVRVAGIYRQVYIMKTWASI
ncbi:MAG: hypothetical protein DRH37_02005 [Deltaproteobacteria bacterium]|nr:MAG: hypothetical protein DRH37_02005 [Deltaproteobacteria bacterium]